MDANELTLILVRHGRYYDHQVSGGELSPLGVQEINRMAGVIASLGFHPNHIWHSGKKRAEQTADLLSAHCGGILSEEKEGIDPGSNYQALAKDLRAKTGNLLIVSHLPFLERLAGEILFKMPDQQIMQFYPGSMLCLKRYDMDWHIKWFIHPDLIRENEGNSSYLL